jgi:hypothetical protein
MKKTVLIALAALLIVAACKKNKTTGHLWVHVNMQPAITRLAVPDSLSSAIAGGSLITPGNAGYVINTASDNSSSRTSKVLDFGELKPGTYQVDSIHGYAYGDSLYVILGALDTTPVFTITSGHDQNLSVTFQ